MLKDECTYIFSTKGMERKKVAGLISHITGKTAVYEGVPTFGYAIGDWKIDRNGSITTPELSQPDELQNVLNSLIENGLTADGKAAVTTTFDGHNGNTLKNIVNMVYSKSKLLKSSLDLESSRIIPDNFIEAINKAPLDTVSNFRELAEQSDTGDIIFDFSKQTIYYYFFNSTLDIEAIKAYATLCQKINTAAISQKRTKTKQTEADNEKYAMRCWLLKLGFIGAEFEIERRFLLKKLYGNAAFKTPEQLQAAREKQKQACGNPSGISGLNQAP